MTRWTRLRRKIRRAWRCFKYIVLAILLLILFHVSLVNILFLADDIPPPINFTKTFLIYFYLNVIIGPLLPYPFNYLWMIMIAVYSIGVAVEALFKWLCEIHEDERLKRGDPGPPIGTLSTKGELIAVAIENNRYRFGDFYPVTLCDYEKCDDAFWPDHVSIIYFVEIRRQWFHLRQIIIWRVSTLNGERTQLYKFSKLYGIWQSGDVKCFESAGVIFIHVPNAAGYHHYDFLFVYDTRCDRSAWYLTPAVMQEIHPAEFLGISCVDRLWKEDGFIDGWKIRFHIANHSRIEPRRVFVDDGQRFENFEARQNGAEFDEDIDIFQGSSSDSEDDSEESDDDTESEEEIEEDENAPAENQEEIKNAQLDPPQEFAIEEPIQIVEYELEEVVPTNEDEPLYLVQVRANENDESSPPSEEPVYEGGGEIDESWRARIIVKEIDLSEKSSRDQEQILITNREEIDIGIFRGRRPEFDTIRNCRGQFVVYSKNHIDGPTIFYDDKTKTYVSNENLEESMRLDRSISMGVVKGKLPDETLSPMVLNESEGMFYDNDDDKVYRVRFGPATLKYLTAKAMFRSKSRLQHLFNAERFYENWERIFGKKKV